MNKAALLAACRTHWEHGNTGFPGKYPLEEAHKAVKRFIREEVSRIIEAYHAALAKAGLGIRPREPTEAMCRAATERQRLMAEAIWKAMWDAHPDKPDG